MRRVLALTAAVGLAAGCSKSSGDAPAAAGPPVPVVPVVAQVPEPKPAPPPAPVPFRYPDDAGGKAVAAALAPSVPREARPAETGKPRARTSELDRGEVPLPRVAVAMPKAPPPKVKAPKPSPPPERVPADLGQAADPSTVRLTERGLVRADSPPLPTAADVPPLARQLPDRASLDDPTAEIAAARVVFSPLPVPFAPGWFVRFTIPDPFELAEHMKAKTGTTGELGTKPVDVSPARPK